MTKNVYRTAQGQVLDMGALLLKNENVRAVGNMKVNARGDKINERGQVIDSKRKQISRTLERTTKGGTVTMPSQSKSGKINKTENE